MSFGLKTVLICGATAWLFGNLLNSPVPPEYENPWQLRFEFALYKLFQMYHSAYRSIYGPREAAQLARKLMAFRMPKSELNLPIKVKDDTLAGVKVRIYTPEEKPVSGYPAFILYHGGGWVLGTLDSYHDYSYHLAHNIQAVVISVDYRLAPEHVYPAAIDDCFAVTRHVLENAEGLGLNPERIAIGGDSAGGNLAAATALKLRDAEIKPKVKLQVLIYPTLQGIDMHSPSFQANANDPVLPPASMANFIALYATGTNKFADDIKDNHHTTPEVKAKLSFKQLSHQVILEDHKDINYKSKREDFGKADVWKKLKPVFEDPYFMPLMADNVGNLPEAIIITVHQDVLRDDGIWYAKYMEAAGVKVTHRHYRSGFHGLFSIVNSQRNNVEGRRMIYDLLKAKL